MYVKILNASETHHGFVYREGENVCATFNAATLHGDGLHYTDVAHWAMYFPWGTHFREVLSAVDGAPVDRTADGEGGAILNGSQWKARAITLGPVRPYADLLMTEDQRLAAVTQNRAALSLISEPSAAVALRASQALYLFPQDGDATTGLMCIGFPKEPEDPDQPTGRCDFEKIGTWPVEVALAWQRLRHYTD